MARRKAPRRKRPRRRKSPKRGHSKHAMAKPETVRTLKDLSGLTIGALCRLDIALLNVICALGLPGAEKLDIPSLLDTLDEWARQIRIEIDRNYDRFLEEPSLYSNSQAYFCILCMIQVLQSKLGVRYNSKWTSITPDKPVPQDFGRDAKDLFIHPIIDGIGGTCGSLPVLYAAVGRRLGYPLKIVKAARHLFVRWDDPNGKHWFHPERFNIEASGPGVHRLPDEHYRTWPHKISDESIEAGVFLKSLTPREELAEFLAARGHCLRKNGRPNKAANAFRWASELAPHNPGFRDWHARLTLAIVEHRRISDTLLHQGGIFPPAGLIPLNAPEPTPPGVPSHNLTGYARRFGRSSSPPLGGPEPMIPPVPARPATHHLPAVQPPAGLRPGEPMRVPFGQPLPIVPPGTPIQYVSPEQVKRPPRRRINGVPLASAPGAQQRGQSPPHSFPGPVSLPRPSHGWHDRRPGLPNQLRIP